VADHFPSATVIRIDLSPVQATWVPSNAKFERIRPNSEVQADVDHGDHNLFHKCEELSKVTSFLEKSVQLAQTILLVWQNAYRQLNVVFLQRS
jgi:hypothetical protein